MNKKGKMITGDQAIVTKKQHKSPCSDCPFRRDSIPGWLGQLNVDQWVQLAHGEGSADCHTQIQGNGDGWSCAGLAIYRSNVAKSVHDPSALRLPADRVNVFSFGEFKKHHESKLESKPEVKAKRKPGPRTDEEIDAEVATLREMKPRVRRFSGFGDDHHAAIELQILVLEERMDTDEINDQYEDADENNHAYECVQWMEGDVEEAPSAGWKELVR
jgi:hypothetical protein